MATLARACRTSNRRLPLCAHSRNYDNLGRQGGPAPRRASAQLASLRGGARVGMQTPAAGPRRGRGRRWGRAHRQADPGRSCSPGGAGWPPWGSAGEHTGSPALWRGLGTATPQQPWAHLAPRTWLLIPTSGEGPWAPRRGPDSGLAEGQSGPGTPDVWRAAGTHRGWPRPTLGQVAPELKEPQQTARDGGGQEPGVAPAPTDR